MAENKSVILVTVDCLRADHCGFMGYLRPTTRFLDGLAGESFVFPAAIVAGVPTYYSFPAILASRYPLSLGREVRGLAVGETTLASVFREGGYATAFFGAGNPYLGAQFGYDCGFDTFCDLVNDDSASKNFDIDPSTGNNWLGNLNRTLAEVSHKIPGMGAAYDELYFQYCQRWAASDPRSLDELRRFPAADVLVAKAEAWLSAIAGQPFFLWLHFMDPHAPYYPTEEGLTILGMPKPEASRASYLNASWNRFDIGSERLRRFRDEIVCLYDAGICWVDAQLSKLTETLRRTGLWENCIFAVTADHGEAFLEHGSRYHAPALGEELIHVPLLIRVPGSRKKQVCSNPFSMIHLAPTLLAAAGLQIPGEFQGENYWTHMRDGAGWSKPAITECVAGCTNPYSGEQRRKPRLLAVREARYKLVLNFDAGTEHLFDLESDPGENSPLAFERGNLERRRLLEAALEHLTNSARPRNSDAYLRTRLREIGLPPGNDRLEASGDASFHVDASRAG